MKNYTIIVTRLEVKIILLKPFGVCIIDFIVLVSVLSDRSKHLHIVAGVFVTGIPRASIAP